jgi:glycosyltransferase involved in cell wall biosynthesis
LREAIDSILSQSFTDFELLIFDDASTDDSRSILESYSDPRIIKHYGEKNVGLVTWLNLGIERARGEYVARMDSDDVSHVDRLKAQVDFLDKNPEVGLCGTSANLFGLGSGLWHMPTDRDQIHAHLMFGTAFIHPAVVFRKSHLDQYELRYRDLIPCEDIDLFRRASKYFPCGNIDLPLFNYRIRGATMARYATFAKLRAEVDDAWLREHGVEASADELALHMYVDIPDGTQTLAAGAWLVRLRDENRNRSWYSEAAFEREVLSRYLNICLNSKDLGQSKYREFIFSPLLLDARISALEKLSFATQMLIAPIRGKLWSPIIANVKRMTRGKVSRATQ